MNSDETTIIGARRIIVPLGVTWTRLDDILQEIRDKRIAAWNGRERPTHPASTTTATVLSSQRPL